MNIYEFEVKFSLPTHRVFKTSILDVLDTVILKKYGTTHSFGYIWDHYKDQYLYTLGENTSILYSGGGENKYFIFSKIPEEHENRDEFYARVVVRTTDNIEQSFNTAFKSIKDTFNTLNVSPLKESVKIYPYDIIKKDITDFDIDIKLKVEKNNDISKVDKYSFITGLAIVIIMIITGKLTTEGLVQGLFVFGLGLLFVPSIKYLTKSIYLLKVMSALYIPSPKSVQKDTAVTLETPEEE